MSDKIYVNTVGVEVRVTMSEDISSATVTRFLVRKPQSGEVNWVTVIEGTSVLKYITVAGDLDEPGVYYLHPYLEIGGWSGYGTPVHFKIYDKWR